MKQLIYRLGIGLLLVTAIQACQKNELGVVINDGIAPGQVTNVTVENLSGAAKLTYSLPKDEDLLYVKAVYTTKDGVVRESKVSHYTNSLMVVGFADTDAYEVKLYAVDKGENASQPVSVTVNPTKPAYIAVRESLQAIANFGGIDVSFQNPTQGDMAIVVVTNDSLGRFVPYNTYYTNASQGTFLTRGLPDVDTRFGIYVRDRWGNISDTLIVNLKPIFETLLDRTKMKEQRLQTDAVLGYNGTVAGLFDGIETNFVNGTFYHSGNGNPMPQWFTFDMGVSAQISRMKWFMRQAAYYAGHSPRKVEIWGSNNPPADGSFGGDWVLLTSYEQIKPSGLPLGQLSAADNEAAAAGETITFPAVGPKVRYIRFKTLENWSGGLFVNFMELKVWGDPK